MSETFMVWYRPGYSEKVKADSLRDCADIVRSCGFENRRRRERPKSFLILSLDYWKDFKEYFKFERSQRDFEESSKRMLEIWRGRRIRAREKDKDLDRAGGLFPLDTI